MATILEPAEAEALLGAAATTFARRSYALPPRFLPPERPEQRGHATLTPEGELPGPGRKTS